MGRLLKHRSKDEKWRLWSTISDGWLTDWLTEAEMKQYLVTELEYDYKVKVIERLWSFPHGYYDKDENNMFDNRKAYIAFTEWHLEATRSDDYYAEVDKKLKELTEGA